jgi:hypothetical protein
LICACLYTWLDETASGAREADLSLHPCELRFWANNNTATLHRYLPYFMYASYVPKHNREGDQVSRQQGRYGGATNFQHISQKSKKGEDTLNLPYHHETSVTGVVQPHTPPSFTSFRCCVSVNQTSIHCCCPNCI